MPRTIQPKAAYTTGEVAKVCHVNLRTVIRWIERGRLDAYQLPGRGDNRIPHESLVAFLNENNIPIPSHWQTETIGEKPTEASEAYETSEPTGPNNQILIVDDDPLFSSALVRIFKRAGYPVLVAKNGFEAGSLLEHHRPAIMTLDLQMPGMRGEDVLEHVRSQPRFNDLKVIVISAAPGQTLEKALELGASTYLSKPFANPVLLATVQQLLNESSALNNATGADDHD